MYERVRVVPLLHPPEHDDGWRVNQRPSVVEDVGYLIDAVAAAERHTRTLGHGVVPRPRGLRPRLRAVVVSSNATVAFAAERQVVRPLTAKWERVRPCASRRRT